MEAKNIAESDLPRIMETAGAFGLLTRTGPCGYTHFPISLTPSKYPRDAYEIAMSSMCTMNKLYERVARNPEWMYEHLEPIAAIDRFVAKMIQCSKTVHEYGVRQTTYLQVNRSDYMVDETTGLPYQVEMNIIASGLFTLSPKVAALHQYIEAQYSSTPVTNIQLVDSLEVVVQGFLAAYNAYGQRGALLMLSDANVQEGNMFDQFGPELEIWRRQRIITIRASLSQLQGRISKRDDILYVDGKEIFLVYFRQGYAPKYYPSDREWEVRTEIEKSRAIKCPSIDYQLSGCKKIQQVLSEPQVLRQFLDSEEEISMVSSLFTGLWAFENLPAVIESEVRTYPDRFVLKPQREGGSNNFYDKEIIEKLDMLQELERREYILMRKIGAASQPAVFIRELKPYPCHKIAELGIFGVVLSSENGILVNKEAGYLLRSKLSDANETGITAGFGVIDSVELI